jgi:hypothetical protein
VAVQYWHFATLSSRFLHMNEGASRVSELRAAELLDDLCEDMRHYTWTAHPGPDFNPPEIPVISEAPGPSAAPMAHGMHAGAPLSQEPVLTEAPGPSSAPMAHGMHAGAPLSQEPVLTEAPGPSAAPSSHSTRARAAESAAGPVESAVSGPSAAPEVRPFAGAKPVWHWQRTTALRGIVLPEHTASKVELDTRRKELKSFCYSLVERTEERLTSYLASDAEHHEGEMRASR